MNRNLSLRLLFVLAMVSTSLAAQTAKPNYPPAAKHPVTRHYGNMTFHDDYEWLENANDPAVKAWVEKENALTRSILDAVPARDAIAARLTTLFKSPRTTYSYVQARGGRLFAMKSTPPKEQSSLVVFDSPSDSRSERLVFDPTAIDPSGATTTDFYVPSLDGKRVAISLSKSGSEDGSVHIFDVDTGRDLGDVVPRVNFATAGGPLSRARTAAVSQAKAEMADSGHAGTPTAPDSGTRAIHRLASGPPKTFISISRSGFTPSVARLHPTRTPSARSFRASRRRRWKLPTTAATSWPRSRTATAARASTGCAGRMDRGLSSRSERTRSSMRPSAETARCICSRTKAHRTANFFASRQTIRSWRAKSSSPRAKLNRA